MTTFGQLQVAVLACLVAFGFAATAQDAESFGPGHRYGQKEPSRRAKGSLRIASYNVLNYFDDVDDPALSGEWDDKDLTTSTDRLRGLAKAIRRLDADVLALQEVESRGRDHSFSRSLSQRHGVRLCRKPRRWLLPRCRAINLEPRADHRHS